MKVLNFLDILQQIMRNRSHSSVPFVMLALLNVGTWKNILKVYMRDRNSSVSFAMLAFLQIITWKDIMKQYIRDHSMAMANLNKSEDLVTNKLLRLLRIFMRQTLPQHQRKYLWSPESASIEIPLFRPLFINFLKTVIYKVNLISQWQWDRVQMWY